MTEPEIESRAAGMSTENQAKASGDAVVSSMAEIGRIILRRGMESTHEGITGILDENRKSLKIPLPNGTILDAIVAFPSTELSYASKIISISCTGPAPAHYKAAQSRQKTVILFGKERWQKKHRLAVIVNKFFFPEAKEFEEPKPAETPTQRALERGSYITIYENKDGVDDLEVTGPIDRLREKTLAFATEFANQSLQLLRDYDQERADEKNQAHQLSASTPVIPPATTV